MQRRNDRNMAQNSHNLGTRKDVLSRTGILISGRRTRHKRKPLSTTAKSAQGAQVSRLTKGSQQHAAHPSCNSPTTSRRLALGARDAHVRLVGENLTCSVPALCKDARAYGHTTTTKYEARAPPSRRHIKAIRLTPKAIGGCNHKLRRRLTPKAIQGLRQNLSGADIESYRGSRQTPSRIDTQKLRPNLPRA